MFIQKPTEVNQIKIISRNIKKKFEWGIKERREKKR